VSSSSQRLRRLCNHFGKHGPALAGAVPKGINRAGRHAAFHQVARAVPPEAQRAPLMVDVLPTTLEGKNGELTRGFLERFGADPDLRVDVRGSRKRDPARKWLAETSSSNVRRWAEEFIDEMTAYADEARIQEEREF
jgi:hypothetical protein